MVPRVGATAQLANTKGTAAHQLKAANDLANHICTQINDVFQRGETVSLNDLNEMVKPHAEGIDFDVIPLTKSSQRRGSCGCVRPHLQKGNYTKYSIELPCKEGNLRPYHMETIGHELTHFFTGIKLPKITARNNIVNVAKPRINSRSNISLAIGLSTSVLGGCLSLLGGHWGSTGGVIVANSGILAGRILSKLFVPTKAFEHYNKVFYNLRDTATKDPDKIKQLTQDALNQTKLTSNEKIDMLQHWRYGMIDEQNAYNNGEEIDFGIDAINGHFSLDKLFSNREYMFREKIALVEDLLKEEIAAHRESHRKALRKDYSSSKSKKSSSSSISS